MGSPVGYRATRLKKGQKSAQNDPLRKAVFFRLTWVLISGRFGPATDFRISPVSTGITARLWRALLFLGFAFSVKVWRDAATAPHNREV